MRYLVCVDYKDGRKRNESFGSAEDAVKWLQAEYDKLANDLSFRADEDERILFPILFAAKTGAWRETRGGDAFVGNVDAASAGGAW